MASEAHDDGVMNPEHDPATDIPAAALQTEGGQRLEVTPGDAPEGSESIGSAMAKVFDPWFQAFNDDVPGGPRPDGGTVSWKQAQVGIDKARADCPGLELTMRDVFAQCGCTTRHMHAPPTALPLGWSEGRFVLDEDNFRARNAGDPELPSSYFAVQIDENDLGFVLQQAMDIATGVEPPIPSLAEANARAAGVMGRMRDNLAEHGAVPIAEQPTGRPVRAPDHRVSTDAPVPPRTPTERVLMPRRFRLLRTPDGYVAAWYGPPRTTEAEAVADAWRRSKGRKR